MGTRSYKSASVFYLFGNLFNKGITFLTVPIFTRILSTSDYGVVTTYNSWIAICTMIIGVALHMGIRAAFIDYKEKIDDFMSVIVTFILIYAGSLGLIIFTLLYFFDFNIDIRLIILCFFQSVAAAIIEDYSMYLMMKFKYKIRTALMILPNLCSVMVSIIVIMFLLDSELYMGRIIPTAGIIFCFGIVVVCMIYRKSHKLFCKEYIVYGLKISAPLVIHGIALNILSQSDRTMITWLSDVSQTGIYSLIYNFSMIAMVITTSLDGVWIPWFTERLKDKDIDKINYIAKLYIRLMTFAMVCIILVGPEVVKLMAAKSYWEGIVIIPPIILSNYVIFAYTLYVNIEHFHKKTVIVTLNTVVAAVTNIVLNYIFIPEYGYVAAAYSTLISYLIIFILHSRYAKKLEKELYPLKTFFAPLAQLLLSIVVFYVFMNLWMIRFVIIVIYIAVIVYLNREIIKDKLMPALKKRKK